MTDEEIVSAYTTIRGELTKYSDNLTAKPEIIVLSKLDLVPPEEQAARIKKLTKHFKGHEVFALSAGTGDGVEALKNHLIKIIPAGQRELALAEAAADALSEETPEMNRHYDLKAIFNPRTIQIKRVDLETFVVSGGRIEELARMTNMNNREAVLSSFLCCNMQILQKVCF